MSAICLAPCLWLDLRLGLKTACGSQAGSHPAAAELFFMVRAPMHSARSRELVIEHYDPDT